jgi:competence protein ComFC
LLVDDVLTTGYTLNECSRMLKDSGAEKVYAVVIAAALHI